MDLPMPTTKRETMGEVNVKVRLSNAADVEMVNQGLLEPDRVRSVEVDAVVDTGAAKSILPSEIVERLGVSITRKTFGILADGRRVPTARTGPILFEIEGRTSYEDAYVLGDQVLIGQTVLESTDLLVDCTNRKLVGKHPEGPLHRL
ncbi:MAG: retroviral-like aspartic protease [Acidobacteria bacterium]|nr:retroviral-like aspartic protease [Acidobacteriota bacterium]